MGDADAGRALHGSRSPSSTTGLRAEPSPCSAKARRRRVSPRSSRRSCSSEPRRSSARASTAAPPASTPGFILATSLLFFAFGRAASMDMLLAAFVSLAIGLLALAVLRIAGRLAIPVALGLRRASPRWPRGRSACCCPAWSSPPTSSSPGNGGFSADCSPLPGSRSSCSWQVPGTCSIYRAQGQAFLDVFLLNHNLQRFTSTVHNHPGPIVLLPARAPRGALPLVGRRLPRLRRRSPPNVQGRPLRAALARRPARLLLRRRIEAPRLRPPLPRAPRAADGPRQRRSWCAASPCRSEQGRGPWPSSASSWGASWPRALSCSSEHGEPAGC